MAAEMSCLADVDEDDKDAEPEINAFTLLQEPVRMPQESASCTDSFNKPSSKQNSVLDALSNTDMLSSVGLGNGPSSHQATQAHDLNSLSTDKEESKSITPLKNVQEIDTAGIWGFDEDSPDNSLDNFSGASNLHWDPHKEFMQFLWESHGDSPGEEPKDEVPSANNRRRRKRKMDMVVMVDPSEDLYPDLSPKSSEELSDAEGLEDSSKSQGSRKFSQSPTEKVSKYPNGSVKAIKDILYNGPARNSHENSINCGLSPLKRRLTMNSHSEEKPKCYPCSKCKLIFQKEHHLRRHMKTHVDHPNISPKPFICRECGQAFRQSVSLIAHMSVHQEKREQLTKEIKGMNDKKKQEGKKLFCPQCPFVTNCPNTFVQHAKTHEKDKRKFRCDKCSFRSLDENDLRRHTILQHTVITVGKRVENEDPGSFACNSCSYRAFSKSVFKNHLLRRHQQTYEEYEALQCIERKTSPFKEKHGPTCETPVGDAEFTSKILIKDHISSKRASSPCESSNISDLFKHTKIRRGLKPQLTESKLDKSINVLLSRQRHGKKTAELKKESNNCSTSVQNSKSDKDGSDQLPQTLAVKVEDSGLSPVCDRVLWNEGKSDLNCISAPKMYEDQSTVKKSPSKRKMSTPYRNTSDQDSCFILPKPSPKKINQDEESDYDENDVFTFKEADFNTNRFDKDIKKEKPNIIYTYSRRMSMRGALQASKRLFEKIKTEEQDPDQDEDEDEDHEQDQDNPEIKEECMETEVFQENFETHQIPLSESFSDDMSDSESDRKNCPYCPAIFESGVGLSNHVRGHLHRAGLSYNARHEVPPEQVASHDRRPRIRRRMSAFRRLRKALQMESESEAVKSIHSCPLCGDSFDNRTGQSNHIRGHLKKLGKTFSKKSKSPLFLLRELMRDKKEFQRALQILGKRRNHFQYGVSPKLSGVDCFRSHPIGIPKRNSISSVCTETGPRIFPTFSLAEMESDKRQLETKLDVKNSLSGTTALIGILKKRKCQEDARPKGSFQMSRNPLAVPSNGELCPGSRVASSLPRSTSEKGEFNRKVCVHCNASFHSGVSLSNHLRAYAKRKRTALEEGTTFDCKIRRQRSRPGPKKKTLPLPQTPEEMYRLTCRFCDLVFQGPLSVQEDWIKHLQRHIMNTSVPHTGLGMVEVTSLSKTLKTDQDSSLTATNAAS
ncbi:zinc finger protein 644a [Notolabrus celidotus]|uniref:zinc finger protein 644a n=1 Tax=Notolabrus celidotus TaxID=1203425 RepID=UPI00148FC789|nr:zinc finger protein 644a [Notolabrus celidotus]XP_034558928.1 zinc finger protein 644a [Notolabrus celidotus]XP_034558929.1 zinc finger protein 644a [Notolabrus celidotus]